MTLTELDAFLAFAQGQRRARVGDTCAALLATLRVVHQELMPWRSHFTGLELGFSGLDASGTLVPETRFLIAPTAPSSWKSWSLTPPSCRPVLDGTASLLFQGKHLIRVSSA